MLKSRKNWSMKYGFNKKGRQENRLIRSKGWQATAAEVARLVNEMSSFHAMSERERCWLDLEITLKRFLLIIVFLLEHNTNPPPISHNMYMTNMYCGFWCSSVVESFPSMYMSMGSIPGLALYMCNKRWSERLLLMREGLVRKDNLFHDSMGVYGTVSGLIQLQDWAHEGWVKSDDPSPSQVRTQWKERTDPNM